MLKKSGVVTVLLLSSLLFVRFAWTTPAKDVDSQFAEKVNLALRRTGHCLLLANGDSTTRIAPVQTTGAGTFLLRLERPFNYNLLPKLLQESFNLHDIHANYDVAVLDCAGIMQLGYDVGDLTGREGVPCGGREQTGDCHNLQVSFPTPATSPSRSAGWWMLAAGFLLGGIAYAWWRGPIRPQGEPESLRDESLQLRFGGSSLDLANQTLLIGAARHQLTYRETKLLHLFVSHPQQLLTRDSILQAVWNDEGIIVGRSVDVFVSRLRKLLREDPGVRIATIHGVGYRLEVE
ncbi:MAG: winged helix-turn-helix domain-containing protein [Saprospiraceae bacterium]